MLYVVQIFGQGVDILEFWWNMNSECKLECRMNAKIGD